MSQLTDDERIVVDGGATVLTLGVGDDGRLHQLWFGPPPPAGANPDAPNIPIGLYPLAYPTFGEEVLREPALRVTQADGVTSTRLVFERHHVEPHEHGLLHTIELVDRVAPLAVSLCYRSWPAHDLIEQWVQVLNRGDGPCTLHQAASCAPALSGADPHLTHWGGGWAREWTETTERLTPGTKVVASAGGVRSALHAAPIVLVAPDGGATETTGAVLAATVAWGGDVRFDAESSAHTQLRLIAGAQHRGAERVLEPGDVFTTPSTHLTWSTAGIGPTSRALHGFVRSQVVRDGRRDRAVVANTWEAVGFALDPAGLVEQIDGAADIGAELFLLDDGWFGTTHPRNDDTAGLGDWEVDRTKLPDGLQPVIDATTAKGLRFGLWVEPEMVNPASELYERHPDWVIGERGRERREERQQLVLDLCRPDVAAFCVETIVRLLDDHVGITYLKWDANRDITEPASSTLPPDRQSHLPVDRVHATWAVMAEVARRHPEVELMLCASGGGRSDIGTLRHFHELWTSDDTDPVDRVRIQWGASHLLPAQVLAAHVTRWGRRPVDFACAVALSGRFGFDLDVRDLTDAERRTARSTAETARRIRDLVQHGHLHRLVSPVGADRAALAYVDDSGEQAVVFAYRLDEELDASVGTTAAPIVVPALSAGRYHLVDLTPGGTDGTGTVLVSSAELAAGGLGWPTGPGPCATIWLLTAAPSS